jgi:hypothetical protein
MTKKTEQNAELYKEITQSGKSLLQLYTELRQRYNKEKKHG